MSKTIRVGAVSYLNTKPLLYAFKHGFKIEGMLLIEDYPSRIASMLLNDEIDVGLIPVAAIPQMREHYIIANYCIGAERDVASVCIFSEVPLQQIKTVLLDYQSKTSVALAKILLEKFWKHSVKFEDAKENFIDKIKDSTAAVVIGDKALKQLSISSFTYDLAEAWIGFTGLPFVFAAWVANKPMPENFISQFNEANKQGLQNIDAVISENICQYYDLKKYFTENISYEWTEEKRKGLEKFLSLL